MSGVISLTEEESEASERSDSVYGFVAYYSVRVEAEAEPAYHK